MKRILIDLIALIAVVWLLSVPWADTLTNLQTASCAWYDAVYAEWQTCKASEECQFLYDLGAYARDGGPTSKPAKMCSFRVEDIMSYCATGTPILAWSNATKAVQNWIGQVLEHWFSNGLPEQYLLDYFGLDVTSALLHACDENPTKLECEKDLLYSIASGYGEPAVLEPTALSILAEIYTRTCD